MVAPLPMPRKDEPHQCGNLGGGLGNGLDAPLPTPEEMNSWDRASAALGLRTELLMENASREALAVLREVFGDNAGDAAPAVPYDQAGHNGLDGLSGLRVLLLAGPGNNGGDAIALARHLHDAGALVLLLLARPARSYTGASGFHLRLAKRTGTPMASLAGADFSSLPLPDVVVDGLLGTGLKGDVRPEYAAWIQAINRLGEQAFVLALDIPSGLNGLTGQPSKAEQTGQKGQAITAGGADPAGTTGATGQPDTITVRADATVTFEAAKLGLALPQADAFVGELLVRPIGIPRVVRDTNPASHFLLLDGLRALLPGLRPDMHKGTAGRVLILGGSQGLTGAPLLAALGALRAGAGLVTVACPKGLEPTLKAGHPDIMTLPLGHGETWSAAMAEGLPLQNYDALVIGPGIGRGPDTQAFLDSLWAHVCKGVANAPSGCDLPIVWDADALFWLAARPQILASLGQNAVLTPHPGEMARLLGKSIPEVEADRFAAAHALALGSGAAVVLKGAGTVVCCGDAPESFLSPFAVPALAVGGSGDVLSGLTGSLLARSISPLHAACLGVYWHGLAGRLLSANYPNRGNLASEIAGALPRALTEWLNAES